MSMLSLSPFSSSPLHGFRPPKSSSGRSTQAGCGDSDWPSLFPFPSDSHPTEALPTSDSFTHYAGFPSSTSFSALTTTSPTFLSPLEPHTSSPALISPKFFSPLDTLSPPRHFSTTTTITSSCTSTAISSPPNGVTLATSPLFTSPLTVSPTTAASSSLTSSLTARRHEGAKAASMSPRWASPTPAISSTSPLCSTPALPVKEKRKTPASTPKHSPQRGPVTSRSRSPHSSHLPTSPVSLATTASSSSSPSSTFSFSSSTSSQPASALSDMSNYLTFEVLNIDPATGVMTTEETPFSPANEGVYDFIAMHQPLQDALAPSLSGPPADDYHSMHHLDDPETLIRGRSPSPASAGDDEGEEDEGMITRFASPPASFFTPSPPQHFAPPLTDSSPHTSATFAPFPSSLTHSIPSHNHYHSSSHQPHNSKPLSPSSPPTLHPSSYPHLPSHHFSSHFKHVPNGLPITADAVVGGDLSFPEDELDPGMLNLIFSPVGDGGREGVAMEDGVEGEEDQHYVEAEAEDLILHRSSTGGDRNRSTRKRHPRPVSPVTARRFSFPALRMQGASGAAPFAPLSPSLSVSSHNSSGSSPLPRSFASDEEGSVHSQGSHGPRLATVQASVMAHQVTPVTAMRVLPTPASVASAEQPMTALPVAQPGSASPSPTPAMAVKAASVSAPNTPSSSAVVSAVPFSGSAKSGGKGGVSVGTVIAEAAVSASIPSTFTATALIPPSSGTATQMATASPASPTLASASPHVVGAVQATATGSPSPASLQRARVVGAGSLHPRQAFAMPQSKKMKMKHTAMHSSTPLFANRVASALPSAVQTAAARPAGVVHATPVQASAVQGRTWRTASK